MAGNGNIVIIEDDAEDKELFEEIVAELGYRNKIVWMVDTHSAFNYLKDTREHVSLIFSDINLPGRNGLALKKDIDNDPELRKKSIPFVFLSTSATQQDVNDAFINMTVQGFFKKQNKYSDMKNMIDVIFKYWLYSKHPNSD